MERTKKFYVYKREEKPTYFVIDASSARATYANWSGKNPVDRSKRGIKKNIIIDQIVLMM